jgi:hypothetical protein
MASSQITTGAPLTSRLTARHHGGPAIARYGGSPNTITIALYTHITFGFFKIRLANPKFGTPYRITEVREKVCPQKASLGIQ